MKLPIPQDFNDWKIWARELVRRLELSNSVAELAKRLAAGSGVTLTYDGQKQVITLAASGGGVSDGDKGDITVSSSGAVWTIDNQVVTLAKIQNIATDRLLGRTTAGNGAPEEIVCTAAGRALLDDADAAAQRATLGIVPSSPEGRVHVVPQLADFTWVNQGNATATQRAYGISFRKPRLANAGGSNWRMLVRAAPSTPYTITMRLKGLMRVASSASFGPLWRNSSTGAFHVLRLENNGGFFDPALAAWSSLTTFSSNTVGNQRFLRELEWFRLSDNGTNRTVEFSADGDEWLIFWTGARTTGTTPDQVGIGMNNYPNNDPAMDGVMTLLSWEAA